MGRKLKVGLGPPLHTGAPDSGRARKVLQLNKQGAPRGPWGRWAGWWAGLWRVLRWVELPLLIKQARDDGIKFFYKRGSAIPGLSGGSVRPPLRASDSHHLWPLPTAAGSCCAPRNGREDPHCISGYRNLLDQCIFRTLFELPRAH